MADVRTRGEKEEGTIIAATRKSSRPLFLFTLASSSLSTSFDFVQHLVLEHAEDVEAVFVFISFHLRRPFTPNNL